MISSVAAGVFLKPVKMVMRGVAIVFAGFTRRGRLRAPVFGVQASASFWQILLGKTNLPAKIVAVDGQLLTNRVQPNLLYQRLATA